MLSRMDVPAPSSPDHHQHLHVQRESFTASVDWFAGPQDPEVAPRLDRIVRLAGIRAGERVLDAGSGTGALLPHLLATGARVTALDLTPAMLAVAEARFAGRARFVTGDLASFPGEQDWDAIVCNAMFWNLFDQAAALERCRELLVPGGRLVISHPMGAAFVARLREQDPGVVLDDPVDDGPLRERLAGAGLHPVLRVDEPLLYTLVARRP